MAGYDFGAQEWGEPEWATAAGDIPLSIGVNAGLGAFVKGGDAVGLYLDFELSPTGGAAWGIEISFSRSGAASFFRSAMSATFVDGCGAGTAGAEGSTP